MVSFILFFELSCSVQIRQVLKHLSTHNAPIAERLDYTLLAVPPSQVFK